ncbi:putative adhesin [Lentzea sp. NPDC051208]|uniref:putative adhesin n=1 Tax=Lentzea sp. NPDC051208 TaxID=3154642 RepID=UPI003432BDA1
MKGHGVDPDGSETFVPDGVTIVMYTAHTVRLCSGVALLALLDECGEPGDQVTGPARIKNYRLSAQDDEFMMAWYSVAQESDVPIWWVGTDLHDGIRLCESDDDDAVSCRSLGTHTCTGVLGQVLAHDNRVALVTCRGSYVDGSFSDENRNDHVATRYDATTEELRRLVRKLNKLLHDGHVQEAENEYDALPQGVQALLWSRTLIKGWQLARWVKYYADASDLDQLFGHLDANAGDIDEIVKWLDRQPSYGEALDRVADRYPDSFYTWVTKKASKPVSVALAKRPRLQLVAADRVDDPEGTIEHERQNRDRLKANQGPDSTQPRVVAKWLVKYADARTGDMDRLFRHLEESADVLPEVMIWLERTPGWGRTLDALAASRPDRFFACLARASDGVARALLGRAAIQRDWSHRRRARVLADLDRAADGRVDAAAAERIAEHFWERLSSGDTAMISQAEADVRRLNGNVLKVLGRNDWFDDWLRARRLLSYVKDEEITAVFQLMSDSMFGELTGVMKWFNRIPAYGAHFDECVLRNRDEFSRWLRALDDERVRRLLTARQALRGLV